MWRGDTPRRHDPGALDGSLATGRGARPLTNGAAASHVTEDWHGPAGPAGSPAPRPPPGRAEAGALRITVDDPVKKAEAGLIPGYSSGYVLYRVQTVSKLRSYRGQHASVRRRFRDFVVRCCPGLSGWTARFWFTGVQLQCGMKPVDLTMKTQ